MPERTTRGIDAARGFRSLRDYQATPVPVRLAIRRIHVASSLERLGRARDGTVEAPSRWEVPGWYELGPLPGDPGSAVILGHVDSKRGPARRCSTGCASCARVTSSASRAPTGHRCGSSSSGPPKYDKQRFPTDDVYYPALAPTLRLVTCGKAWRGRTSGGVTQSPRVSEKVNTAGFGGVSGRSMHMAQETANIQRLIDPAFTRWVA